jgi:hypothetical protein
MTDTAMRIAALNDAFRRNPLDRSLGKLYMTAGVNSNGPEFVARAISAVIAFDAFTSDNDPHREHDFGSFDLNGEKLFWKIDYYSTDDPALGSEDPSDAAKTERALTIMLADEY